MSTRGLIARQNLDGSFDSIYVHFGHPNTVGPVLLSHYTDPDKIGALMALGSLSYLGKEIGTKHPFNKPHPDWCLAYHRDRGDPPCPAKRSENLADLAERARRLFIVHVYVWRGRDHGWSTVRMPEESQEDIAARVNRMLSGQKVKPPFGLDSEGPGS